jgi:hypothetical protein
MILPADATLETVRSAVARVSKAENIRVEQEIASSPRDPALLVVENIALKREVDRLRLVESSGDGAPSPTAFAVTPPAASQPSAASEQTDDHKLRLERRRRKHRRRMKAILGSRAATWRHLLDLLFRRKANWRS